MGRLLDNLAGGTGGITVAGATTDFNRFYQNDTIGLDILTAGAVTLNYVDAGENPVGIRFPAPGNRVGSVSMNYVSVTNNSVLSTGYGLLFESIGTVTLSNIDVRENFLGGVKIDNSFAATPKAVTLTNIYSIRKCRGLRALRPFQRRDHHQKYPGGWQLGQAVRDLAG